MQCTQVEMNMMKALQQFADQCIDADFNKNIHQ
jgi:hypothetical protein